MIREVFNKIKSDKKLSEKDLISLLEIEDEKTLKEFFEIAYQVKVKNVGNKAYFRGIIEFSNICEKDCFYCGIRKSNENVKRFLMTEEEIIKAAEWAYKNEYGSIVIQAGEVSNNNFVDFIEKILIKIKNISNGKLGVTLSLGEQSEKTFKRWFVAGAHRYLLRIETSNQKLYAELHPHDHSFEKRINSLTSLKKIGYQVGTGVMIGLPGQTLQNLVDDILFFKKYDIDMIGMGPYIVHKETPMGINISNFDKEKQLNLGLKMIAASRVYLKDVNIASTTALQALNPIGREMGIQAGANIIMPNLTDTKYRSAYQLYEDKPCLDENSSMCRSCLTRRIEGINESIGFNEWGDSPHFLKKECNNLDSSIQRK